MEGIVSDSPFGNENGTTVLTLTFVTFVRSSSSRRKRYRMAATESMDLWTNARLVSIV